MSLPNRIREISRDEANRAFRDFMAFREQQGGSCTGTGTIISISNGVAQVRLPSGEVKSYTPTGNRPMGVGTVAQIVGNVLM